MFDWAPDTPLHVYELSNNITEQLQNGRHDTSFFTHLHREQSAASAGKYVFIYINIICSAPIYSKPIRR